MRPDLNKLGRAVLVADGAWSTQLRARGFPDDQPLAELANLTHAHLVETLANEYLDAGARILTTNTFSAGRFAFERLGLEQDPADVCRAGAALACKSAEGRGALVAGVIGPSGSMLKLDETPQDELAAAFADAARALCDGGVGALVLETFTELDEILLAIDAVTGAVDLPLIASMCFELGPQHTRTQLGAEAAEVADALSNSGAAVLGCNCGVGIDSILPSVVALRAHSDLPIWVKPSAGLPELHDGAPVYRQSPDDFDDPVPTLLEAGVSIIGGCCGTGPEHIRRLAAIVKSWNRKARVR